MNILLLETLMEKEIMKTDELIKGLMWGEPRPGHSEGQVVYHVKEIFDMINKKNYSATERELFRLIALVHDSFKYQVDLKKPKTGDNHHGWYARQFAGKFIQDENILEIIQWHDEPFNIHRCGKSKQESRLETLLGRPIDWKMFIGFISMDYRTGDKNNDSADWFLQILKERGKLP